MVIGTAAVRNFFSPMLVPPSKRIAISASVATRWTSWNVSRLASRSENSDATAATTRSSAAVGSPIREAKTLTTIAIERGPGDDQDDAPEIEDIVHVGPILPVVAGRGVGSLR